jgi:hypothetical protein
MSHAQVIHVVKLRSFYIMITDYVERWNVCLVIVISSKRFAVYVLNLFLPYSLPHILIDVTL